jgi:hypothetical protein
MRCATLKPNVGGRRHAEMQQQSKQNVEAAHFRTVDTTPHTKPGSQYVAQRQAKLDVRFHEIDCLHRVLQDGAVF